MYYISKVHIQRFRSINSKKGMEFEISDKNMPIAICGQNNVGKTNTLRAINLFFNPECFDLQLDIPVVKKATHGGSYYPKITLTFKSQDNPDGFIEITRDFKNYNENCSGLKGKIKEGKKIPTQEYKESDIKLFLSQIEFRYIQSIDVNISEIIDTLTNDILDTRYNKARFSQKKKDLKSAYDQYSQGLQEILDTFSSDVSEVFHSFRDNWNIKFTVPKKMDRFRDMISDDVELKIDDKSGLGVSNKGSGLQRLAVILLNLEVLKRMDKSRKNTFIVCIDEPDIYLHEGLQKKLYEFIINCGFQIFYTTHSKNFIDQNNFGNIIFLEAIQNAKSYERVNGRIVEYITTAHTPLDNKKGYKKICEHLGIKPVAIPEPVLGKYNILVEGECDKKYLSKLAQYFGINQDEVNFIIAKGVDRINPMLDVYNSFSARQAYKPIIHVLYDDDSEGRPQYFQTTSYLKDKKNKYTNIIVHPFLIRNFAGKQSNNGNYEIEDLMYPEIICYILNKFLKQQGMIEIDSTQVLKDLAEFRFINEGILKLCDIMVGFANKGVTTSPSQFWVKGRMCELFDITDIETIQLLEKAKADHPAVKEFVTKLFAFEE